MVEILGGNLKRFFDTIDNPPNDAEITYAGNSYGIDYEVWEISDDLFKKMCDMNENRFRSMAGGVAWWRYTEGSVLGYPDSEFIVNGKTLKCWNKRMSSRNEFTCLTEYLRDNVGVSLPKNVCACAVDLAKYNDMKLSELFETYERIDRNGN
ncbi:hypothetical protein F170042I7_20310 [Blautia caecimuris]|uniref:hypothetical protein n=1 Tax=Blautia caecimuris TaxID=1796615 RepID=UPI0034AE56A1